MFEKIYHNYYEPTYKEQRYSLIDNIRMISLDDENHFKPIKIIF
jgi:hypothetical protein